MGNRQATELAILVILTIVVLVTTAASVAYDAGHADGFHEANAANNAVCHGELEARP